MPARAASRMLVRPAAASRWRHRGKSLSSAKWILRIESCRAPALRGARRAPRHGRRCRAASARSPSSAPTPARGRARGAAAAVAESARRSGAAADLDHQLAGRHERQQRHDAQRRAAPAVPLRVGHRRPPRAAPCRRRSCPDRPGVAQAKNSRRMRCPRSGCHATLRSNGAAAGANQVIADVRTRDRRAPARAPAGRARRSSAPAAAAPRPSAGPAPRRRGGSGRGCGSPSGCRRPRDRAAAPARPG